MDQQADSVLAIWGAIALSYTVFPKREKVTARG